MLINLHYTYKSLLAYIEQFLKAADICVTEQKQKSNSMDVFVYAIKIGLLPLLVFVDST